MKTTRMIEQYLDGTLSTEEKQVFEAQLLSNKELSDLVQLHKEVNESIKDDDFHALHDKIVKIMPNQNQSVGRRVRRTRPTNKTGYRKRFSSPFYKAAAALIVLFCLGFVVRLIFGTRVSTDRIYQMYYTAYEPDINSRTANSSISIFNQALLEYQQESYSAAYRDIDTYLKANPENYTAIFYKGMICLAQARYKRAMETLNKIPSNWKSPYLYHRDWYLALAYIKLNRIDEATTLLTRIKSGGGYYSKQADEILKKLSV